jgi:hypothetical protein
LIGLSFGTFFFLSAAKRITDHRPQQITNRISLLDPVQPTYDRLPVGSNLLESVHSSFDQQLLGSGVAVLSDCAVGPMLPGATVWDEEPCDPGRVLFQPVCL